MRKVELLAPAGDLERLKIDLLYGADAVYFGGQEYSLRANATNFSIEEIKEGCDFAHNLGKRCYLTLNIVFHNEDLEGLYDYIDKVVEAGIDAFIISDPFIIRYIKDKYPNVECHVSTQDSSSNYETCLFFKEQGIDRVVLARELSVKDIKEVYDKTGMDLEVFIHGAMCTFFSGRCVLSNYFTNRDSNRGGCAQVCRFAFNLDNNDTKFTIATKDLSMSHHVKDLIENGAYSLKIEGRMRSPYYLATVVSEYRKIIDAYYNETLTDELMDNADKVLGRLSNRPNSTHYYFHEADMSDQYYSGTQEASNQDFIGAVIGYDKDSKILTLSQRNNFKVGQDIEIMMPSGKVVSYHIDEMFDKDMNPLEVARHPEEIIKLKVDEFIEDNSFVRVKI